MALPVDDSLRGTAQPYDIATTTRTLDLTTASASITLATGVYDLHHTATGAIAVRIGAAATTVPPSTGAAEVTGFVVPAGAVATVAIEAGDLHARTLAATGTLYIIRKVLP